MKTKIVYTVVSTGDDMFLPQAMVASYSARRYNPDAEIVLVVDEKTEEIIDRRMPKIRGYLNSIVSVQTPEGMSNMHKSRFLKTTLRQNIEGDFIYIDVDTIVTCDLSGIDNEKAEIAAVIDRHSLVEEHALKERIVDNVSHMGLGIGDLRSKYFNGGVMYVKDCPIAHQLYNAWYANWNEYRQKGRGIDQPPLALANKQCGYPITELDGTWNCQLSDNFINYLSDAKILHYFTSNKRSPYRLYDKDIFYEIMQKGDIPKWLRSVIENPRKYFVERHILAFDEDVAFLRTNIHVLYMYHRRLFNFFESISKMFVKK